MRLLYNYVTSHDTLDIIDHWFRGRVVSNPSGTFEMSIFDVNHDALYNLLIGLANAPDSSSYENFL